MRLLFYLFFLYYSPVIFAQEARSAVSMVDAMTALEVEQANLALNLAHSLAKEKRYSEAVEAYQEFLRVFSQSPRRLEARENLALIFEKRQRYDFAIAQYEALYRELGISPAALLYHLEAARLYELTGETDRAVGIYKELNQIDPNSRAASVARERMQALNLMQKSGEVPNENQLEKSSPQNE